MKKAHNWLIALALLCITVLAGAQEQTGQLYVGPSTDADIRWAAAADFDGSILFCRGLYSDDRYEDNGSGWWTDYPGADQNFLVRLSELTKVRVRFDQDHRVPFYVVVSLNDPLLMKCPILFMEDVGVIRFTDEDVRMVRAYLLKGGFIWVDDFWGSLAWDQWEFELRRILPSGSYPMFDIPTSHPIMHSLYNIPKIWQQPNVDIWNERREAGGDARDQTSERYADSSEVHFRAVENDHGRIMVVMTHNTDIADGWEEEKPENAEYVREFSARSYALGINIFLYALTH